MPIHPSPEHSSGSAEFTDLKLSPEESGISTPNDLTEAVETVQPTGLTEARGLVEAADRQSELKKLIAGIDFSEPGNYHFAINDTYHGEAATGQHNTRLEGTGRTVRHEQLPNGRRILDNIPPPKYVPAGSREDTWGRPSEEAHYSGQAVEKAGIRAVPVTEFEDINGRVPADGLKGKLGFKKNGISHTVAHETDRNTYVFDYAFAAPASQGNEESQRAAGNYAGQNIQLSVRLDEKQAVELSSLLEDDPAVARDVLDAFVSQTGDKGKWEAEIFDEEGNFHDPGKRYGVEEFAARDVRPNYAAVPELKPQIVGLVSPDEAEPEEKPQLHHLAS